MSHCVKEGASIDDCPLTTPSMAEQDLEYVEVKVANAP